jgi:hypothetical protein
MQENPGSLMKRRTPVPNRTTASAPQFDLVEPQASALIESLRSFGYSLRAAVADLVDNSIAASAKKIWLRTYWSGAQSYIALIDDGHGMSQSELINAMRPGSKSPTEQRETGDLGRFGLGLKTASFSQCRRLTVWSRRDGKRAAIRCWDLDYVRDSSQWRLLSTVGEVTSEVLTSLRQPEHGTIVLREKMDRLVGGMESGDQEAQSHFHDAIDEVGSHLSMVFHRYMTGSSRTALFLNGDDADHRVQPWDPFLTDHPATQSLPAETLRVGESEIHIEPFVLPHHDRLSKKEHSRAGGLSGWNAQQGFYVYRNDRLLVPGSWLNLGYTKEEHYKLARIAVSFPSSLDHAWHIDVKKSVARPPRTIRKRLQQLAEITRRSAVEVYRHRDPLVGGRVRSPKVLVWKSSVRGNRTIYQICRDHPLVLTCMETADSLAKPLRALLKLIEETVPVHHIWLDSVQNATTAGQPFENAPSQDALPVLQQVFLSLRQRGHSEAEAQRLLRTFEGLDQFANIIDGLSDANCEQ